MLAYFAVLTIVHLNDTSILSFYSACNAQTL
jgi:hypothetical protein